MIGSTLIERKAAVLFLFPFIETGLFRVEKARATLLNKRLGGVKGISPLEKF